MESDGLFCVPRFDPKNEEKAENPDQIKNSFLAKARARAAKRKQLEVPQSTSLEPPTIISEDDNLSIASSKPSKTDDTASIASSADFEIFDDFNNQKRQKLDTAFPRWCQKATKIASDFGETPIEQIEDVIHPVLFKNLKDLGYRNLFPVQSAIIPELTKIGPLRDYAIQAPTGSGKTIAFLVPILQKIIKRAVPYIRALIVLPTRELALQVYKVLKQLTKDTKLKSHILAGASDFANSHAKLTEVIAGREYSTCDILVATPGRLVDHLNAGIRLDRLKFLVIDEADRMSGNWLAELDKHINRSTVQKLLFSATLASDARFLSAVKLRYPKLFTSGWSMPSGLSEEFVRIKSAKDKPSVVKQLIQSENEKAIIFTNAVNDATALNTLLREMEISSDELSSNLDDWKRKNAVKKFTKGNLQAIVCSDVAARGLDIDDCNLVINYDIAPLAANHVHRSGRTARAGKPGKCITLISQDNQSYMKMMKELGRSYSKRKLKIKKE